MLTSRLSYRRWPRAVTIGIRAAPPRRGFDEEEAAVQGSSTTAPNPKPSVQTRFVLDAMATKEKEEADRWEKMMAKMDRLAEKVMGVEEVQNQLLAQVGLAATVAQRAAEERILIAQQMERTEKVVAELRLEQMARDLESADSLGENRNRGGVPRPVPPEQQQRYDDANLFRHREFGNRRVGEMELPATAVPRQPFPRFDGEEPRIWLDKCLDYFTLYRVPEQIWIITASLSMEGNASKWFQIFKIQHGLGSWAEFSRAVIQRFGEEEYPQAMRALLHLYQAGSVEEYVKNFEDARYATAVHNHTLDETFYVAQFIKGLKHELQAPVQSHVPSSVGRAVFLARLQQSIMDKQRQKSLKGAGPSKFVATGSRTEVRGGTGMAELSKERLVKEYRRQNGLCFSCGDKFEPGHQLKCSKRVQLQLNSLTKEELGMTLTEEQLDQIQQEEQEEERSYLSLHAMSGATSKECMRVRALVGNQTLLILIDSGSSATFVNRELVDRLGLLMKECQPVKVKVANGELMQSDRMVEALEWWSNGHSFTDDMRVLDLGAYDMILGFDWLQSHSPMHCDWKGRIVSFVDRGQLVQLVGDSDDVREVKEVSKMQVEKWLKGNEIWVLAVLEEVQVADNPVDCKELQGLLEEFKDVFELPIALPPSCLLITIFLLYQVLFLSILDHINILPTTRLRLRTKLLRF